MRTVTQAIKEKEQLVVVAVIRTDEGIFECTECGHNLFRKKEFSTLYKCRGCGQIYRSDSRGVRKKKRKQS